MLRFCIELIRSSSDRGWSPTVFGPEGSASPEGHYASVRGTRVPEATSGLGWLPCPSPIPPAAALQISLDSAFRRVRRGFCASRGEPLRDRRCDRSADGQGPMRALARQVQPPSRPTITARDAVADLLRTSPAGIPSRVVRMNATMSDKLRVGSFVATTIGASQPNDNPFRAHRTR